MSTALAEDKWYGQGNLTQAEERSNAIALILFASFSSSVVVKRKVLKPSRWLTSPCFANAPHR